MSENTRALFEKAHKRLVELRDFASDGPRPTSAELAPVVGAALGDDLDLAAALHRTIDVQLELFELAFELTWSRRSFKLYRFERRMVDLAHKILEEDPSD